MNITYGDVTFESIPRGRRSVIRFLWAKQPSTNAVQSKMHPVWSNKYCTRTAIHVWCKKFAQSRESVVEKKRPGRRAVLTNDDQCNGRGSSFSCIDLIDGINA